jgi:hypothetical protein
MRCLFAFVALALASFGRLSAAQSRVWTDSSGAYTLEAELIATSDTTVVLKRADHELVAIPLDKLSAKDREYLKSKEGAAAAAKSVDAAQAWKLKDGSTITGRVVDYARRDMTLQRRRGRIYVNDRQFDNLPDFYQQLIPKIVAELEKLPSADRRALEAWVVQQRGRPRIVRLDGVVLETQSGDEYGVPFFLFADDDQQVLKSGWDAWLAAHGRDEYDKMEDTAFLLRSLAAARHHDAMVKREIALMQLQLQKVEAGLTSLWEVTLYPVAGQRRPPRWVVVPGRDSRQATVTALAQHPGYVAGPVRRVSGR